MSDKTIVILTEDIDPHTDMVIEHLQTFGARVMILHTKDIPQFGGVTLRLANNRFDAVLTVRGVELNVGDIQSIWWRRPEPFRLPSSLSEQGRQFASLEVKHAFAGFIGLARCYFMSNPRSIAAAAIKPEQLRRASELGFRIPRTVVTSDVAEALRFCDSCGGRMIFKVLSDPSLRSQAPLWKTSIKNVDAIGSVDKAAYSVLVTRDDVLACKSSLAYAPCQFQEYIDKKYEVRVTVVESDVFVVDIDSQSDPRSMIDWRKGNVPMRAGVLPDNIKERCVKFVKSYGLAFSAIDLICATDGAFVFIENNPNGQWGFVERQVPELRISLAIARELARRR